jgi:OHCU decarboxylase
MQKIEPRPGTSTYPRDLVGYGRTPPHPRWPGNARIAVQFVLNYEEGGENSVLHGDAGSERFLSDIVGAEAYPARHMSMESLYEYGSRVGVWRILREFEKRRLPLTVFGVAMAMERNPDVVRAFQELGHEIACHGWRWIHYQHVDEATEREHMVRAVASFKRLTGAAPLGWYTGRDSPNTRRLVVEHGGFLYDSDYYGDELPFWAQVATQAGEAVPHLIVPYTLDANDMRFATPQGFNTAEHFCTYLRDSFDTLYAEGAEAPRMMSVGMHCRLLGRPGRIVALQRFLDHVAKHDRVWVCRRVDIARHWAATHPYAKAGVAPTPSAAALPAPVTLAQLSDASLGVFTATLGSIFESSPWIAEAAWPARPFRSVDALHAAMAQALMAAPRERRLALIHAHPELAGKEAAAGELTVSSQSEQAGAGLDRCSPQELARLRELNRAYRERHGFPFVMAVKGRTRSEILAALEQRLANATEPEFDRCMGEIVKIARFRLDALITGG